MHLVPGAGVWALFVEGASTGNLYKFEVLGADGVWRLKADPMARFAEAAPHTASIVYESQYAWGDDQWMWYRGEKRQYKEPMSVYEVHIGSWRKGLTYLELANELVEYCSWQGYTHVEFLPVAQHPFEGSWGYHVTGYFAPMSKFGSPDEFRHLVDKLHQAGIGVLIDWVPGHFATDPWALPRFDGTALYEHEDPRLGWHPDWGSYIFNFGRNEVKSFLVSNAYFWLHEFHIDGLRVDAVASMLYLDYSREAGQWVPNKYGGNENLEAIELLQTTNKHAYEREPGTMIVAEESTSWPGVTRPVNWGGLGFGFKWNMGWMNDSLRYIGREPIYRQYHHHEMTFAMAYAYSENFILPISHDEVVHGKGSMFERIPQDEWRKFGTLRAFYAFMWSHPGKKLLFMGTEFGQRREFSESRSVDWWQSADYGHRGVQRLVKDLNAIYKENPALWKLDIDPSGFSWIDADDHGGNVFAFLRYDGDGQMIACITNFSSEPRPDHRLGLPAEGVWKEILNTDAEVYDGTGHIGNLGQVVAHADAVARLPGARPRSPSRRWARCGCGSSRFPPRSSRSRTRSRPAYAPPPERYRRTRRWRTKRTRPKRRSRCRPRTRYSPPSTERLGPMPRGRHYGGRGGLMTGPPDPVPPPAATDPMSSAEAAAPVPASSPDSPESPDSPDPRRRVRRQRRSPPTRRRRRSADRRSPSASRSAMAAWPP